MHQEVTFFTRLFLTAYTVGYHRKSTQQEAISHLIEDKIVLPSKNIFVSHVSKGKLAFSLLAFILS